MVQQHWRPKRSSVVALASCIVLLLLLPCLLLLPGLLPTHFREGFSARLSLHSLFLEEQIRSVARKPGDLKETLEVSATNCGFRIGIMTEIQIGCSSEACPAC